MPILSIQTIFFCRLRTHKTKAKQIKGKMFGVCGHLLFNLAKIMFDL